MHRLRALPFLAIGFVLSFFAATVAPAQADNFGRRITLSVAPNLQLSTTGDANAPPPAGYGGVGYTNDHPVPETVQLDYGLDFRVDKKTHLFYSHSNFDYAIGRVLTIAPKTSFVAGEFADRVDTIGFSRDLGHGLSGRVTYFNQVRQDVTGLCLSQAKCGTMYNPESIDFHGYGVGGTYNFGPRSRIGQIFIASIDAKYVPRSDTGPAGANLNGLGKYVGSQVLVPYSITAKVPIVPSTSVIPIIGYERASVLYRGESTPEMFNVVVFGVTKVINKNLTFNITNLNLVGCKCSDTVPPPDNVRITQLLAKFEYKTAL